MVHTIEKQVKVLKKEYLDIRMTIYKDLQQFALDEIDFAFFGVYNLKFILDEVEQGDSILIKVTLQYEYKNGEETKSSGSKE